jgi:hypothetical protein
LKPAVRWYVFGAAAKDLMNTDIVTRFEDASISQLCDVMQAARRGSRC